MKYDTIIGLEIHAELKTKSKMFCTCKNDSDEKQANKNVCPICLGHPGALPYPNKKAIEDTVLIGLALNCKIHQKSKFDRKNYFYPDLPKGYQISQLDFPFSYDGHLEVNDKKIQVTRIHLEEDTAKSSHPAGKNYTLVDFNRSGAPLIEMVTEPVITDSNEAKKFCQIYQQILKYLNISDASMEKGEMRCEANVSIQEKDKWQYLGNCEIKPVGDYKLNPKVELKNINSFKALEKAIDYEVKRQINAKENNEELIQETRGWNDEKGKTISQRVKETSADYRYFPDPDIPPIEISNQWIEEIRTRLVELPQDKKTRFKEQYDLNEDAIDVLISDKNLANFTEKTISELRAWINASGDTWERQKKKLAKSVSNWLSSELLKFLKSDNKNIDDTKITPENFAELISLIYQDKINSSAGQTILKVMYEKGGDPTDIMKDLGLEQMDNNEELEKTIKEILKKNEKQVAEYKSGKENVIQYLVGQTMAATKGKANPKKVQETLKKLLS